MKTLIYVLFLALCGFLVIGWFLDWYRIQDLSSSPGKYRLEIEIDAQKIRQDIERGRRKLEETWRQMQQRQDQAQASSRLSLRLGQE
ncbi:MAG: hypothetical protein RMI91_02640 [Gemmatales bacterium]|nr:hypothetical protein [Gemmatales bacterium]MDW7993525.1 hypothetical protein [Gemmatales bacterium]